MGRPAYSRKAIVRALLLVAHPDAAVPSVAALTWQLRNNPARRAVCGIEGKIPSQQVFCAVYQRLAANPDALAELFVALTDRIRSGCPGFGRFLGADSTTVATHANPNRRVRQVSAELQARYDAEDAAERQKAVAEGRGGRWKPRVRPKETSDPEASWTKKHHASAPGGRKWVFGYKAHTLCDAATGLPIAIVATTNSAGDSLLPPELVDTALVSYDWLDPAACSADRGYDAVKHYSCLLELNIAPVIRKKRVGRGRLHYGVYTNDGVPTCSDGAPLEYVRADGDAGCYVYRLSDECLAGGGGCFRRKARRSVKGYQVEGDEVWVDPQSDARLFGYPYRRSSPEWRELYRMRESVERMYSVWKGTSVLERHCYRGLAKVLARVLLTAIMRQAIGLLALKRSAAWQPADDGLAAGQGWRGHAPASLLFRVAL